MLEIAQDRAGRTLYPAGGRVVQRIGDLSGIRLAGTGRPNPVQRLCHARPARRGNRSLPQNYHRGRVRQSRQGARCSPFDTPLGRLGFLLCSDRTVDNCAVLGVQGAQVIFIPMDGSARAGEHRENALAGAGQSLLDCHCQHLERGNYQPQRGIALGEVRNRMRQRAIPSTCRNGTKVKDGRALSHVGPICTVPWSPEREDGYYDEEGKLTAAGESTPTGNAPEGSGGVVKDNIVDIRDRVARHDLRYDAVPFTYFEGFILGNGELGAVLWFEEDRMVLSLDKADVWERRADQSLEPGMDYRTALQQARDG